MKTNLKIKSLSSLLLCLMLTVAMACSAVGCSSEDPAPPASTGDFLSAREETMVLGEGQTEFTLLVVDQEGTEYTFQIHTDQETVGAALLEEGLIAGEEGAYGLYVTSVLGITADYEADQSYWAFYINGAYANTGVDTTTIVAGDSYELRYETV
ncbi:MAG: DUF4430 domain-containing protein [Ruminiclostridium sp.]|nr:DUF4430 domain-containing protein [Ruminiclostridium sp.]